MIKPLVFIALCVACLPSCVVVQGYEKISLNDPDMELSSKKINAFQTNAQSYREAASGGNGGKTGGGCGCN